MSQQSDKVVQRSRFVVYTGNSLPNVSEFSSIVDKTIHEDDPEELVTYKAQRRHRDSILLRNYAYRVVNKRR